MQTLNSKYGWFDVFVRWHCCSCGEAVVGLIVGTSWRLAALTSYSYQICKIYDPEVSDPFLPRHLADRVHALGAA